MLNMKTLKISAFTLALGMLLSGCYFGDEDIFGCIRGNGDVETEQFFLPQFTGVKLDGIGEVFVRYGDEQEVLVETDENLMNYLDTDVHNGIWTIDFDRCTRKITRLKVYITLPYVDRLIVSGSGSIVGEDVFEGDDLETTVSGSGSIDFHFEGTEVDATISGSGVIDLYGTSEFLEARISGSGNIRAFDMITQECDVYISGSGDLRTHVEDFLKVRISGSGDVLYKGHPQLDINISGSGSVLDRN